MLNSTKTWQDNFDENFEETTITIETDSGWTTIPCSEEIKQFISNLIAQTREETLKELIREYQDNELDGKGYDFYFSIRAKIDELNKLKK